MKVAYINGGLSVSETFIYELARGLSNKSETTFLTSEEPHYNEGINYKLLRFTTNGYLANRLNFFFGERGRKLNWQISRFLAGRLKYEIKQYDIVYIDYGSNAVKFEPLLKKLKIPFIVHFHGYDITSLLRDFYYRRVIKEVFESAKKIIAASDHIKRLLILEGCSESKIYVVRYGISLRKEVINSLWDKRLRGHPCICFIGRLTPKKHPIALIRCFKIVAMRFLKVTLHIVGDGPLMGECKALIAKLNLKDRVVLHGEKTHDEATKVLEQAHIYVQHSVTSFTGDQEGFGISLSEAALYELPIVSTFHNGIPENVIDGETGFLVREYDYPDMAKKIIYLLGNKEMAIKMGKKGAKHINNLCDYKKRVESIHSLLEKSMK